MSRACYCDLNINSILNKLDERKGTFITRNKVQIVAVGETENGLLIHRPLVPNTRVLLAPK